MSTNNQATGHSAGASAGANAGNLLKKGAGAVHGLGEAIRGNINAGVDSAAGDHAGVAKNEQVAARGVDEVEAGRRHPTTGTGAVNQDLAPLGETYHHLQDLPHAHDPEHRGMARSQTDGPSSNYGPHETNLGNKLDARYDSDLDHRGTKTGSTSYGPHGTNIANKLDPRYDSDLDHRGRQDGDVGTGAFEQAAQTLMLSSPAKHGAAIGQNASDTYTSQSEHTFGPGSGFHRRPTEPRLVEQGHGSTDADAGRRASLPVGYQSGQTFHEPATGAYGRHADSFGRDEQVPDVPLKGGHPPHKSSFLNLVDPRVSREARKSSGS